ncbi:S8 family peptidase [Desertihabitans aurantiacus]|uniref:S8 family peptidase n=1 Tax=Desertihabitans aurantiacus TaxID=2282477 RepID=UPI000DF7C346|nr:S8 family serine peptidase [Desertihabitans aurantiacus]
MPPTPPDGHRRLRRVPPALTACLGVTALLGAGLAAPTATAADGELMSYVVNTRPSATQLERAEQAVEAADGEVVQAWPQIGVLVVHSTSDSFATDVTRGRLGGAVESVGATRTAAVKERAAEAAQRMRTRQVDQTFEERQGVLVEAEAADPLEGEQWDMAQIGADVASDGSADVTVAVLDSGIDDTHPDLASQVDDANSVSCIDAGVPDTTRESWLPTTSSHGTHVAGTVAAARNGVGIVGVAPDSRLTSVKVVNDDGFIYPEYAICGFVWAAEHGADVTNNSYYIDPWQFWCTDDENQGAVVEAVRRAVDYSTRQGVVHAAAAGNSNVDLANKTTDSSSPNDTTPVQRDIHNGCLDIPAELDGVVTVASNDVNVAKSGFSNYGEGVIDVTAPGSSILSTVPGGYGRSSGTSMASPHAAGVLALLKAEHPRAKPHQLIRLLERQADDVPCPDDDRCTGSTADNAFFGEGLVDALEATGVRDGR